MDIKEFKHIYFACTGNTCRSPMAERILKEKLKSGIKGTSVNSRRAGMESQGNPDTKWNFLGKKAPIQEKAYGSYLNSLSEGAEAVILTIFGDKEFVENHRARSFTSYELEEADLVVTMNDQQKDNLSQYTEAFTKRNELKVYTLGEIIGQPEMEVEDPFGRDELLIAQSCNGLTSFSQDTRMVLNPYHPSLEKKKKLRFDAYFPTYQQLEAMITELCEKGTAHQVVTMDVVFKQTIEKRYQQWQEGLLRKLVHSAFSTFTSRNSAFKQYAQGNYGEAFKLWSAGAHEVVKDIEELKDLYDKAATTCNVSAMKTLAREFNGKVHDRIVPSLFYGGLRTNQGEVDSKNIGNQLAENLQQAAPHIVPAMRTRKRKTAVPLRDFGLKLLGFAHSYCSDEQLEGIYNGLVR